MSVASSLLEVTALTKRFPSKRSGRGEGSRKPVPSLTALDGVSLAVQPGETLGIVGESGSGKSTLARCLVGLHVPDGGTASFAGADLFGSRGSELRSLRRQIQMIYQDPYSSLNPRMRVLDTVAEAAKVHEIVPRSDANQYATALLGRVGIPESSVRRFPNEFSGGQRQRIAIARSLAVRPRLLIADEAVSALDVSVQAQLLALFEEVRDELGLTMIFISHQLSVIARLADRVAILYLGRVVEIGRTSDVFSSPAHPYTKALLDAHPTIDGPRQRSRVVAGETPSAFDIPSGCRFHTRCPIAKERCSVEDPRERPVVTAREHRTACHFPSTS